MRPRGSFWEEWTQGWRDRGKATAMLLPIIAAVRACWRQLVILQRSRCRGSEGTSSQ